MNKNLLIALLTFLSASTSQAEINTHAQVAEIFDKSTVVGSVKTSLKFISFKISMKPVVKNPEPKGGVTNCMERFGRGFSWAYGPALEITGYGSWYGGPTLAGRGAGSSSPMGWAWFFLGPIFLIPALIAGIANSIFGFVSESKKREEEAPDHCPLHRHGG